MTVASLPARDPDARARLAELAGRARPLVLARDRTLEAPGQLGELLPHGLARGSVTVVEGPPGAGVTSLALSLCAAATRVGEWAAALDRDGTLGAEAIAAAGVALERLAVIRGVPPDRWANTVAVLLDGMSLVVAETPGRVSATDARRLTARARERDVILVPLITTRAAWPISATQRLQVDGGSWPGLGSGHGLLAARAPRVRVIRHGTHERVGVRAS